VTLYEMTRAFSVFANFGRRMKPKFILEVKARDGKTLASDIFMDGRFDRELSSIDKDMEERRKKFLDTFYIRNGLIVGLKNGPKTTTGAHAPAATVADTFSGSATQEALHYDPRFIKDTKIQKDPNRSPLFFEDPDQIISPQTAYLMTTLLSGVVNDPNGTGGKARVVGKPVAGKTGSTSDYYDAWFVGFSPEIASGVWVGFDREASMGVGATGGDAALPIWAEYMKEALKDGSGQDFPTPQGIVFANIDNDTGRLASSGSRRTLRQAFLEGTEPGQANTSAPESVPREEEKDLLKEDLSQ
jgi:penicillin-binding protein 1A